MSGEEEENAAELKIGDGTSPNSKPFYIISISVYIIRLMWSGPEKLKFS